MAGQDVTLLASLTLREIALITKAAQVRDQQLAWMAASYLGFPYHEKDKHPDFPTLNPRQGGANTEADLAKVSAWMKVMSDGS